MSHKQDKIRALLARLESLQGILQRVRVAGQKRPSLWLDRREVEIENQIEDLEAEIEEIQTDIDMEETYRTLGPEL
jgi:hypothetical protein